MHGYSKNVGSFVYKSKYSFKYRTRRFLGIYICLLNSIFFKSLDSTYCSNVVRCWIFLFPDLFSFFKNICVSLCWTVFWTCRFISLYTSCACSFRALSPGPQRPPCPPYECCRVWRHRRSGGPSFCLHCHSSTAEIIGLLGKPQKSDLAT